jgi:hypothetical protein
VARQDEPVPKIVVVCERWLGLGARYAVRVDGREVGRLGRRTKRVTAEVAAGKHSVLVDYNGQTTAAQQVNLDERDTATFQLTGNSASRPSQWLGRRAHAADRRSRASAQAQIRLSPLPSAR